MKKTSMVILTAALLLVGCSEEKAKSSESENIIIHESDAVEKEKDKIDEIIAETEVEEPMSSFGNYDNSTPAKLVETFFKGVMEQDMWVLANLYSGYEGTPEEVMAYFNEELEGYAYEDLVFDIYEQDGPITAVDVSIDGSTVVALEIESTELGYMVLDF